LKFLKSFEILEIFTVKIAFSIFSLTDVTLFVGGINADEFEIAFGEFRPTNLEKFYLKAEFFDESTLNHLAAIGANLAVLNLSLFSTQLTNAEIWANLAARCRNLSTILINCNCFDAKPFSTLGRLPNLSALL
jgi:hypothetical protein